VTSNLESALREIRSTSTVHTIWADAICIDQSNNNERADQVRLMGLIYRKAVRVHVWLGYQGITADAKSDAVHAVDLIRRLAQSSHITPSSPVGQYDDTPLKDRTDSLADIEDWQWMCLYHLLQRPWFWRTWVVQELGLSRDALFHCGQASFTRIELDGFIAFLDTKKPGLQQTYSLRLRLLRLTDFYSETHDDGRGVTSRSLSDMFLEILDRARGLQCSDARDRIYAFLGHPAAFSLEAKADNLHSQPRSLVDTLATDYHPSYTHRQLYIEFAATMIHDFDAGFDILNRIFHNAQTLEERYPSWVPRWDLGSEPSSFDSLDYYYASADLQHTSMVIIPPSTECTKHRLRLKARRLASIAHTCTSSSVLDLLDIFIPKLAEASWTDFVNVEALSSDLIAFAITLTAGLRSESLTTVDFADEHVERHMHDFSAFVRHEESQDALLQRSKSTELYAVHLRRAIWKRAVFRTTNGRLGMGSRVMRQGDEVWLPMGSRTPFVFRPVREHGGGFKILGQAY
jgi:hypothetical protein